MANQSIPAVYLGGDPEHPGAADNHGTLNISDTGVIDYTVTRLAGAAITSRQVLLLTPDDVKAVSLDVDARFDALVGLSIVFFPALLQLRCARREGPPFAVTFGVHSADGRRFIATLQGVRESCGEAPVPEIDGRAANATHLAEISESLKRIEALLRRQLAGVRPDG